MTQSDNKKEYTRPTVRIVQLRVHSQLLTVCNENLRITDDETDEMW